MSRSQKDTLYLIEEIFLKNGVDFVSMTETLDTGTPLGMAMIGILSVFAQLEREQIRERMMLGRDARVKSGKYHGNAHDVIGYDYDKATNTLTQNPYDAMMIRNIFQMYASGMSESAIAKKLNVIRWRGHQWRSSNIHRILEQTLYIGQQKWKGEPYVVEDCPNIIDEELWEAAKREQLRRSEYVVKPLASGEHKTLLGGLIWCGCCGTRYAAAKACTKNIRYRYYCYSRIYKNRGLDAKECSNRGWREADLNAIVINQIRNLQLGNLPERENTNKEQAAMEERISVLEAQKGRLIDIYGLGNIDVDSLKKRIDTIQTEQDSIRRKLDEIRKPSGMLSTAELQKVLADFNDIVDTADRSTGSMELYSIVHQLIQSITLTGDQVKIEWNFG